MKDNNKRGIGLSGILFIIFIVLKLCGLINWSWVWVLSPLWITILGYLFIFLITIIFILIRSIFTKVFVDNKKSK